MGITKTFLFDEATTSLASFLKAISHPARLTIIKYLLEHQSTNNKELVEHLGLSQATTSMHLKELKNVDLVHATPFETSVRYTLHKELLDRITVVLDLFLISSY
jgi:DNA-binding transcriptional ArsR family regulator